MNCSVYHNGGFCVSKDSYVDFTKKNENSFSEIVFNHMQEGIIVLDEDWNIVSVNPWAEKVIGTNECELIGKAYSTLFLNSADWEFIISDIQDNGFWKGEVKKLRKNGEIYSEWMNIRPFQESSEVNGQFLVIFRDLTIIKRSQFERRFAAKVLENTSEGVIVTDEKGRILTVNPAFEVVTGYTIDDCFGENPKMFQSGFHDEDFYMKLWNKLSSNGIWKGEIWNKRKNGEVFPEWLCISAVEDSNGKVVNYVAVFSDITDRKSAEDQLRRLAHYDALTGVANRSSLNKRLESLLITAKKYNQQLAVLFLDLDRFKQINDSLGHNIGDLLLKEVSLRLRELIRNKDLIARLGGDEFVIVLPNLKHPKEAVYAAEKIIKALTIPFLLDHHEVYVSTSIGISFFPLDGDSIETLLRNADKAMYKAKSSGRNQYELYHTNMHQNEFNLLKIENHLRKALHRNEFFLAYHPIVNTRTNQIEGIEALLRWRQKELGIVSPSEFIPIAEGTGLIIPISEWVLEQACKDLKELHLKGFKIRVSINISALHFNQESFVKSVESILEKVNSVPHSIVLELTESMIMPNATETIDKLVKLKKLGIKLSVDDFGTGYSNLSYLNRFPLDTLKIDKSFIDKITVSKDDLAIVQAIITLAQRLHLDAVAEGVESKKQKDLLSKENCKYIQGFYITKPLPLDELIHFLEAWDEELLE